MVNYDVINLDGRRAAAELRKSEMRRRPANGPSPIATSSRSHLDSLEDQMLAEPARNWIDAMRKWRFLLHRYAATLEAGNERTQSFIRSALEDLERLSKREDRK